jgi:transcriptional regulator with XRE-family HTH domain
MNIQQRVGRNIRKFREKRKLSQEQLAFETGMHRTYISGIERGIRNPTVVILERLAEKLGVTPADLLD